ncbi:hypothetical protein [Paracoccus methylarcula]|uniref:Uncharacterized protein n=1 Tax=Paracoccus methylarcula TaxID=72022 RepID=A0A3R7LI96_9RHOB|nr:hypothetical protein [Paracoccus methylarcula]RNF32876.1 hypothetical protein A7A09_019565 [Paracoccus methylarcula]
MTKAELDSMCAMLANKLLLGATLELAAQAAAPNDPASALRGALTSAEERIPENSVLFSKLSAKDNAILRQRIIEHMRTVVQHNDA